MTDESLRDELRRRFRTRETPVLVAGWEIALLHPADPEALISEEDFERDERLPYWADVWPSAIVLARFVATLEAAGKTFLELGCGAGLVATAAALAGFELMVTDYYEDALRFTRANVLHHAGADPAAMLLDWRALPGDLERFDVVAASDVLYERPYGELVAETFARTLAPEGRGYLTDPGRVAASAFVEAAGVRGLRVRTVARVPFDPEGARRQTIDLYEVSWRATTSEMS